MSLRKAKEIRDMNRKVDRSITDKHPSLLEWRDFGALNRGLMIPDRGFTKQLHALDPEYEVAWDWGSEKWEIWKFPRDGSEAYHIMTVETKDKSYRELGTDILLHLQRNKKFTAKQICAYLEEFDKQERRRKMEDFKNKLRDIALDSFLTMHCMQIQVPQQYRIGRIASC